MTVESKSPAGAGPESRSAPSADSPVQLRPNDWPFALRIYPEPLPNVDRDGDPSVDREIVRLILARIALISVATYEESRVLGQLVKPIRDELIAQGQEQLQGRIDRADGEDGKKLLRRKEALAKGHPVVRWSATHGLEHCQLAVDKDGQEYCLLRPLYLPGNNKATNPVSVLYHLLTPGPLLDGESREFDISSAVFVFCDLHPWLDREDAAGKFNHVAVRALRDLVQVTKHSPAPRALILLSPQPVVPRELANDMRVLDYPLPTPAQLEQQLDSRGSRWKRIYGEECIQLDAAGKQELVRALSGLTFEEAGNVLLKALVSDGHLGREHVAEALREKQQIIKKDGTLDYFVGNLDFKSVGGLDRLQQWLHDRKEAFFGGKLAFEYEGKHHEVSLPMPKGILLIGVPGGGKSLVAKAVGQAWGGLPLLRLDVGRIFGAYVGESERNMRNAIRVAESVAPAIVWLDEIEKAFPKTNSSTDSGVSIRVMSTFLTWMQERKKAVFVVATGNDISQLPPELSRKGRFDEIFFVGLPNERDRAKIFAIHTRHLPLRSADHAVLARRAQWYTGAEIEQVVRNSLHRLGDYLRLGNASGLAHESDNPLVCAILDCMKDFIPLAKRVGDDGRGFVEKMLASASVIAVPASEDFEPPPPANAVQRRFEVGEAAGLEDAP